jgi:hypothetical protein
MQEGRSRPRSSPSGASSGTSRSDNRDTGLEAAWREPTWPGDAVTSIAVSFEPGDAETHVSVEHSGFEHLEDAAESTAKRYETRWREFLGAVG